MILMIIVSLMIKIKTGFASLQNLLSYILEDVLVSIFLIRWVYSLWSTHFLFSSSKFTRIFMMKYDETF